MRIIKGKPKKASFNPWNGDQQSWRIQYTKARYISRIPQVSLKKDSRWKRHNVFLPTPYPLTVGTRREMGSKESDAASAQAKPGAWQAKKTRTDPFLKAC